MLISETARVSTKAKLGTNVRIGDFTIVHDDVILGDDCVVESHCVIGNPTPLAEGSPLVIGSGALIRSHSVFYAGSTFGPDLRTGHRVTVREKLVAGRALQIGTLCDFQGHAEIGDFVRTHSNVHIGQKTKIGNYVWVFPYVVFTNDPHPPSEGFLVGVTVEDYAVVATMSCVMPGVRIGTRSLVAAHSLVTKDVAPEVVVGGVPARKLCDAHDIKLRDGSGRPAYPWTTHFHRGYPAEMVAQWMAAASAAEKSGKGE
jgi:acetyltransferase-like isoleucine patch superfamily enzyme